MAEETDKKEYLVRGAMLCCRQGTHPRRLNLPLSHGVYAYGIRRSRMTTVHRKTSLYWYVEEEACGGASEGDAANRAVDAVKCYNAIIDYESRR